MKKWSILTEEHKSNKYPEYVYVVLSKYGLTPDKYDELADLINYFHGKTIASRFENEFKNLSNNNEESAINKLNNLVSAIKIISGGLIGLTKMDIVQVALTEIEDKYENDVKFEFSSNMYEPGYKIEIKLKSDKDITELSELLILLNKFARRARLKVRDYIIKGVTIKIIEVYFIGINQVEK